MFTSVDVLNGLTVGIKEQQQVSIPVFSHGDYKEPSLEIEERKTEGFVLLGMESLSTYSFVEEEEKDGKQEDEDSSESSSIGVQSSSSSSEEVDDEGRGDEVQSKLKEEEGAFTSLDSLEDSLPVKRGLSNFFSGKSKSFASLSDASNGSAGDLKKHENPFNKRRRILMTSKISAGRRASYSSLITALPSLLSPYHAVKEAEEEDERGEDLENSTPALPLIIHGAARGLNKSFKAPRSFSLSDLQHV